MFRICILASCFSVFASTLCNRQAFSQDPVSILVPAFTGYSEHKGMRFHTDSGKLSWSNAHGTIAWFGKVATTGRLKVQLECENVKHPASLRLSVRNNSEPNAKSQSREATCVQNGELQVVDFGEFEVQKDSYLRMELSSSTPADPLNLVLVGWKLTGDATDGIHFNLKERRNAASVHLMYPVEKEESIEAFYCEVTAIEDPIHTFYMACGWHRGYFGMQVNSPTERRIIFSVWDSGNEEFDRSKVAEDNRVKLIDKGESVYTGDFGNEGTGGHSHLKVLWKTGHKQRFLVTAQPVDAKSTIFSGYWFHPDKMEWMLISAWKAPKEGGYLRGPHSFSENFVGGNGHLVRKALYANQWIKKAQGGWTELTSAKFSHDPTGKSDRLDRWMGVENNAFFLQHGGFVDGFSKYGDRFDRKPSGDSPASMTMPQWKLDK